MADRKVGRQNPFTAMLTKGIDQMLRQMMFCMPGKITDFDPETQLAQVECGLKRRITGANSITMPVIDNVPVQFSGNDEWFFFHEITPGTEGLIHFSQRAIDAWLDQGGPVEPNDNRMLSIDDAFFSPGYRSIPGSIDDFPTSGAGISNGSTSIKCTDDSVTISVGAQTLVLDSTGLRHNGINIGSTHVHPILSGSSQPGPTGTPSL